MSGALELLELGEKTVDGNIFYNSELEFSDTKTIAKRRAYAKLTSVDGLCGWAEKTIETGSLLTDSYEKLLIGPRLVPPPSLTSVDFSSDGTNNIFDAYLWKGTVNFVCYDYDSFIDLDKAFFRHFNKVKLTLGWINDPDRKSTTVYGTIIDYSFSINEKFHYDCSVTFTGNHVISAAAYSTFTQFDLGATATTFINSLKAQLEQVPIIKDTSNLGDGKGVGDADFGKFNIQKDETMWTAWLPDFIWSNDLISRYVSLTKLFKTIEINQSNFEGFKYGLSDKTQEQLKNFWARSANVTVCINGYSNVYAERDGEKLKIGWDGMSEDLYVSLDELDKIDSEMRKDSSENPHSTKVSLIQFIQKMCGSINESLGNCIDLQVIPYNQGGGNNGKFGYVVTDRRTCVKEQTVITNVDPLNKTSRIRSMNIKSQIDSELASIAISTAQDFTKTGNATVIKQGVFGCGAEANEEYTKNKEADLDKLNTLFLAQYNGFSLENASEAVRLSKKVWSSTPPLTTGQTYGLTIDITVDGVSENLIGQTFKLSRLPSMLCTDNVYFMIVRESHNFQNGDWTTEIGALMMVKSIKDAKTITYKPKAAVTTAANSAKYDAKKIPDKIDEIELLNLITIDEAANPDAYNYFDNEFGKSGGKLGAWYGPGKGGVFDIQITNTSINDILALKVKTGNPKNPNYRIWATGKYQTIPKTLQGHVKRLNGRSYGGFVTLFNQQYAWNKDVSGTYKYNTYYQNLIAISILDEAIGTFAMSGKGTPEGAVNALAQQWAALIKSTGKGHYDGDGYNRGVTPFEYTLKAVTAFRAFILNGRRK